MTYHPGGTVETLIGRGKMNTYISALNMLAQVLRDIPTENRFAQATILHTLMILMDEARQLAGADHAEVSQV